MSFCCRTCGLFVLARVSNRPTFVRRVRYLNTYTGVHRYHRERRATPNRSRSTCTALRTISIEIPYVCAFPIRPWRTGHSFSKRVEKREREREKSTSREPKGNEIDGHKLDHRSMPSVQKLRTIRARAHIYYCMAYMRNRGRDSRWLVCRRPRNRTCARPLIVSEK